MNLSIITSRIVNGVEYVLYRNNDNPKKTYLGVDGFLYFGTDDGLSEMSVADFMAKIATLKSGDVPDENTI
jgi:hypothetical protein